jgi:hypothetical protein
VRGLAEAGAHGVRDDVLADLRQVVLLVDHAAGEAAGEEVSEPVVSPVELLGVAAVQELHPA